MGEDFAEDVVGGDFACDFTEVVHTFADVLAYEVAAEATVETVDAACDGFACAHEGFVMALSLIHI